MVKIDVVEAGQTIDQYKVVRLIANTQNSHLYLVEASGLHKHLVLKLFAAEPSPFAIKKFVDQANLLLEFTQHPHIVNVMHLGTINKRPFMVMPYYPQTLNDLLAVHYQKLSFLTSLGLIKQVLLAIQSLHHLGIVHLDIKPQNIYLDEANNAGLADFDNALVLNSSPFYARFKNTVSTVKNESDMGLRFTPNYASPEQINDPNHVNKLDQSSDVYSIGAVWFRILVGDTLSSIALKEGHKDISDAFIQAQLINIAPDWACQLISDLLNTSALNRPSCDSCIKQIEQHVQTPSTNHTIQADAIQISPTLSKMQQDIKQILLTQGWVSSKEKTRLLATYRMLDAKTKVSGNDAAEKQLQESLQQVIDECEKQLIQDKQLSAWFGWVNYIQIVLGKSGATISSDQYLQMLQIGKAARPDKPEIADALLKTHFQINKLSPNWIKRYLLPSVIILVVLFYWAQKDEDNMKSSTQKIEFVTQPRQNSNIDKLAENEAELGNKNPQARPSEVSTKQVLPRLKVNKNINYVDVSSLALAGTYQIVVKSGNSVSTTKVAWVKVNNLPKVRIMATEVTNALYSICVEEGACKQTRQFSTALKTNVPDNAQHPKINISWYEISEQFIPWLNRRTNKIFSLPSFQQWQVFSHSAAFGIKTKALAHCNDCVHPLARQYMGGTMPVQAISADVSGMYHVFGNAQEWLSDCWQQQSLDGQQLNRCDQAMVAGGSWLNKKSDWSTPYVTQLLKSAKTPTTGFRLVELLNE